MPKLKSQVTQLLERIFVVAAPNDIENTMDRLKSTHPESDSAQENFFSNGTGVGYISEDSIVSAAFKVVSVADVREMFLQAHLVDKYVGSLEKLWDTISDTVEGGRLTEADIPDDYQAIVEQMVECNATHHELATFFPDIENPTAHVQPAASEVKQPKKLDPQIETAIFRSEPAPKPTAPRMRP